MIEATMTCHTPECVNEGIPLVLLCEDVPESCVCGPCDQIIEDVKYKTINP